MAAMASARLTRRQWLSVVSGDWGQGYDCGSGRVAINGCEQYYLDSFRVMGQCDPLKGSSQPLRECAFGRCKYICRCVLNIIGRETPSLLLILVPRDVLRFLSLHRPALSCLENSLVPRAVRVKNVARPQKLVSERRYGKKRAFI